MDTRKRSVVKIISWQLIGFFIMLAIVRYFTGEFVDSLKITLAGMISSSFMFYIHERTWNKIGWGKKK